MSDDYHGNDLQTPKPSVVVGGEAASKMAEHSIPVYKAHK